MGATEILRSRDLLVFSTDMPGLMAFSTWGVSAEFLRISGSLNLGSLDIRKDAMFHAGK
jgi:hypothetical protein